MDREDWDILRELAKQTHKERVAKTPERIKYAIAQFEKNGIEYALKNKEIAHFHARRKSDGKLFQFWASTGKILGTNARGIHQFVRMLNK